MIELSTERVKHILHKETQKTEELPTILRGVYTRYMHLYERYFADIDALNDDKIAELKQYHEETTSLIKYYYMDIPLDISVELSGFDDEYTSKMLGADWHKHLFDSFKAFMAEKKGENKSEQCLKTEFREQNLTDFYSAMDSVFRESFGTGSKTAESTVSGLASLLFDNKE